MNRYAFDNGWHAARERLAAIEAWLDPGTIRHLRERGVETGWQVLEIGAGGGSVAAWLSEQVGAEGHVLATDLNPRFLEALDHPNLEARQHDIVRDPLPEEAFDLVHTRLVLAHLAERDAALDRSIAALKPNGWLVAEEMDFVSTLPAPWSPPNAADRFTRAIEAHNQVLAARGFDPFYGRQVAGDLQAHGLDDVDTEARAFVASGGSPGAQAVRFTFEQLYEELVETQEISSEDLEQAIEDLKDPDHAFLSQMTVAAWGRRP